MKILITGSSGFIGFHLANKLLELGHDVTGIDNHNEYYDSNLKRNRNKISISKNLKFFNMDLDTMEIPDNNYDLAINLAAQAGVRVKKENEYLYQKTNIDGFKKFVDRCIENGIKKVIYASSSSVYSDIEGTKFSESSSLLEPKSFYGLSKLANEQLADEMSQKHDLSFVGLRFFSVYGPWGRPDMAYYLFTEKIKKNETLTLFNQGKMSRDMTYIDDIIDGIVASINLITSSLNAKHEIINLGNDKPISTKKLLKTIESELMQQASVKYAKTTNEAFFTHADIEKAKKTLAYNPKIQFETGIRKFLEWHDEYNK
jgi:UDP-glucuronate 4-epimerase|tara:strand:+ start:83 stop:1027 length:945 start_codon:yes stop_codon:yes gene_type:complete